MNIKRLIISIPVVFVTIWVTDFLIHAVWLSESYGATKELWRPEADMVAKMPFMMMGQFLAAAAFTVIFASFVAEKRCLLKSLTFAVCLGVFSAAGQIIMYAVAPYPGTMVANWCLGYIVQAVLLGVVVHFVYKPLPAR